MNISEIPTVREANLAELTKNSNTCIDNWNKLLNSRLKHGIDYGQTKRFCVGKTFYHYDTLAVQHAKTEYVRRLQEIGWLDVKMEFELGVVYRSVSRNTWAQKLRLKKPTIHITEYKEVYVTLTRPPYAQSE